MSGPAVVCPTPIGNLEDITLRVLAALREADVVACEDTRRTRMLLDRYGVSAQLVSYHEHNEAAARRGARGADARRGGGGARLRRRACRSSPTRATCSCGRAWPPGCRSRCCPGRRRRSPRWWRRRCRPTSGASTGFLPRKKGELREVLVAAATGRWSRSSRRAGCRRRWRCWPSSTRRARSAVCRELTKAHEEVVRGTAAELAARYAAAPPKGEVVLVLAPPGGDRGSDAADPAALDALRELVDAGAQPRKAAAVVAELTGGERERAVPGADRRDVTQPRTNGLRSRTATSASPRARGPPTVGAMRRLPASTLAALACSLSRLRRRSAAAGAGPSRGEVITPYRNGADPYAAGQHRGIDIAAPVGHAGAWRRRAATVRFAGTAGSSGLTVSVRTGDGATTPRTCTSAVDRGPRGRRASRPASGSAPSARAARARPTAPHLHFGVREAGTRHAYRDPLALLPPPPRRPAARPPRPAPAPAPRAAAPARRRPAGARARAAPRPAPPARRATAAPARAAPRPAPAARSARAPPRAGRARPLPLRAGARPPPARAGARRPRPVARSGTARATAAGRRVGSAPRRPSRARAGAAPRPAAPARAAPSGPDSAGRSPAPGSCSPRPAARATGRAARPAASAGALRPAARPPAMIPPAAAGDLPRARVASMRDALLRHDADLLRERRAPSRARVHDDRRRRARAAHAPARRGRLLPHGHRRARRAGRPGGREARHHAARARRPQRRPLQGARRAAQRDQRLLHPHHRPRAHGEASPRWCSGSTTTATSTRAPTRAGTARAAPTSRPRPSSRTATAARSTRSSSSARRRTTGSSGCPPSRSRSSSSTPSGPDFVTPQNRYNEALSFIKGGLHDVSLTPRAAQVGRAGAVGRVPGHLRLDRRAPQLLHGALATRARARTSPSGSGRRRST